ncbi:MAG: histone deacetylase [Verrucomicrobiota bacterium]
MKIITDESCAGYSQSGHPEKPVRITRTIARLRAQTELAVDWAAPAPASDAALLRAHSASHLERVAKQTEPFDEDTPAYPGIAGHARLSAGAAIGAMRAARAGERVFSLMRPPGHHACRDKVMGFCFFNNMAVAAFEALAAGVRRVAIYDFDVHHGNGTEDIVLHHPGVAFYSVHQHPCYPDTGGGNVGDNCFNFPVAPHAPRTVYLQALRRALDQLERFGPELVGVSAGFDAFERDPLAQGTLKEEDFYTLGTWFRELKVPVFSLLEGGYSRDLPRLILAYLRGLEGLAA